MGFSMMEVNEGDRETDVRGRSFCWMGEVALEEERTEGDRMEEATDDGVVDQRLCEGVSKWPDEAVWVEESDARGAAEPPPKVWRRERTLLARLKLGVVGALSLKMRTTWDLPIRRRPLVASTNPAGSPSSVASRAVNC